MVFEKVQRPLRFKQRPGAPGVTHPRRELDFYYVPMNEEQSMGSSLLAWWFGGKGQRSKRVLVKTKSQNLRVK